MTAVDDFERDLIAAGRAWYGPDQPRHRSLVRAGRVLATAACLLAAVVAVAALAGGGSPDVERPAQAPAFDNAVLEAVADESKPVEPTRGQAGIAEIAPTADLTGAVSIDAPAERGPDTDTQKQDWVIIPKTDGGACIYMGGSTLCTKGDANFMAGKVHTLTIPADTSESPFIKGLLPDGFVAVRAVEGDGSTLAETLVDGNAYSLTLPEVPSSDFRLKLVRADGTVVKPYSR